MNPNDNPYTPGAGVLPCCYSILLKLYRKKKAGEDLTNAFNLLRGFASIFHVNYGDPEIGITRHQLPEKWIQI